VGHARKNNNCLALSLGQPLTATLRVFPIQIAGASGGCPAAVVGPEAKFGCRLASRRHVAATWAGQAGGVTLCLKMAWNGRDDAL